MPPLIMKSIFRIYSIRYESESIFTDLLNEQVTFTFPFEFASNTKAVISVYFDGLISNALTGFYKSKYTAADGSERFKRFKLIFLELLH